MRRVVATEFVSLNGVMEDPGGAEGFEHGGWTRPYWNDEIGKVKYDELFASDALLLGRVTYQGFAAVWPSVKDEQGFADRMNSLPKYVVSKTLDADALTWHNSQLLSGDLADEVAALKQQSGGDILIAGSGQVVRALLRHDLVDEYRLLVYPVVLGSGKRLFGEGGTARLRLVEARPAGAGVVLLRYQPDRGA